MWIYFGSAPVLPDVSILVGHPDFYAQNIMVRARKAYSSFLDKIIKNYWWLLNDSWLYFETQKNYVVLWNFSLFTFFIMLRFRRKYPPFKFILKKNMKKKS